jgi:hypothetical protein
MSSLDSATTPSVTVACTVGLEPLMFPTGPTEVMVTPLEPPRLAPRLAPDLVLGLALCEVLRLLDLPIGIALPTGRGGCSRGSPAAECIPNLQAAEKLLARCCTCC